MEAELRRARSTGRRARQRVAGHRRRRPEVFGGDEPAGPTDLSEILGCSVGSVKSTASRGLSRLRELTASWNTFPISNGAM